ncbi:MAG: S8 family serine peptidase [Velocimicrobium sp.]
MNSKSKHFKNLKGVESIKLFRKISVLLVLILVIQCINGYGCFSKGQITYAKTNRDTQAPTAPTNLNMDVSSGAAINLKWNASTDNVGVEGYQVYCNGIRVGQTDKTDYVYAELATDNILGFYITAYDKVGNESSKSNEVYFSVGHPDITVDKQPPATPYNLKIISASDLVLLLTWDISSDDKEIEGYEIYKNGVKIGFTKENNFIDYKIQDESNDKYTVIAVDQSGNRSIESEAVSVNPQIEMENAFEYKTDRYIVKYKSNMGRRNLSRHMDRKITKHKWMDGNYEIIKLDKEVEPGAFIENLETSKVVRINGSDSFYLNSDIEYIQPDYQFTAASADPYFNQQWGVYDILADKAVFENQSSSDFNPSVVSGSSIMASYPMDINVVDAWSQTRGEGVVIAVLDTGIDIMQEDLKDSIYANEKEIPVNGIDDDGNGFIDDMNGWNFAEKSNIVHDQSHDSEESHGTAVAGIIAAQDNNNIGITGVAPGAKILPLKVFHNGVAYTSDIIAAIEYAEQMGAKVVNCSWGSTENNPALKEAIDNSNMLFVCAAGNNHDNLDISPVYPAAYENDNIISVASMDSKGILSVFTNYGEDAVDVAAPGEHIISTFPENQYIPTNGTSMAAAFVSGEAALLSSLDSEYRSSIIKQRILESSDKLSSLMGKVRDGNKINCNNSVTGVASGTAIQIDSVDTNVYSASGSAIDSTYNLYSSQSVITLPFTNRGNVQAVAFKDDIYITDDIYVTNDTSDFYQYSPTTNSWQKKSSMHSISPQALVIANDKIYAFGGKINGIPCAIEEYDPATDIWTLKCNLPRARENISVATVDDLIYMMSGVEISGISIVEEYNPVESWTSRPNTMDGKGPRANAAVINKTIYYVGGYLNNAMRAYRPPSAYNGYKYNDWDTLAYMPTLRSDFVLVSYKGVLYAIGGRNGSSKLKSIEVYNARTDTWSLVVKSLSEPRYGGCAVIIGNDAYIIGGKDNNDNYCNLIETIPIFDDYADGFANAGWVYENENNKIGRINYVNDTDFFGFIPKETIDYTFFASARYDMICVELYDSKFTRIAEFKQDSPEHSLEEKIHLQADERYYVKISSLNTVDYDEYTFRIASPEDDHGNRFSTATRIFVGENVSADINYDNDVDCFRFVPDETTDYTFGGYVRFDMMCAELYDKYDNLLADTKDCGGQKYEGKVRLQAGRTYYVKIKARGHIFTFDQYTLQIAKQEKESKNMEYTYDSQGNLCEIKNNGTVRAYLEYDENGNLLRVNSMHE